MQRPSTIFLALLLCACAQMPPDVAERVKAIGPVIDPPRTAAIYAPLQQKEPYAGVRVLRDLKYGPDARHALDVFIPDGGAGLRPVLMFVHGGAFVAGNKRAPGSPFYDNIMLAAAREGIIGVNVTYRLAPQHPWPAGAADVGLAVKWVREVIGKYGGDPRHVYLMGHSAGAVHVASYLAFPEHQRVGGTGLAGAILVSGLYAFEGVAPEESELAYFGARAGTAEVSSLPGLLATPTPLLVAYAGLDPRRFVEQAQLLKELLCVRGKCPRVVELAPHSHMSEVYAINTADRSLSTPIVEFVKAKR
jgi:triacylglycerol lipase